MQQYLRGVLRRSLPKLRSRASLIAKTSLAGGMAYSLAAAAAKEKESKKPKHEMGYRLLGNTGLQVSVLSFGFWATFGAKDDLLDTAGIEMAKKCLKEAREGGVNLFDNAEAYGSGRAERIMGEAIRQLRKENPELWRRSDILITTKIFWGGNGVNEGGLSRKHVREGVDAACERLQTDYVDLVFCHRPDPLTPTETVVRAMTDVVRSGKATAWGTSEWSAQQITEAFWIARTLGLEPPQFEQPQYHMFHREKIENEFKPLFQQPYNYGTTIWSPLASGMLTGKYNNGIPEGSRFAQPQFSWLAKRVETWEEDGKLAKIRALERFAESKLNCSTSQLALAWAIKNPNVSTVLLGASKPEQIEENLAALSVARKLTVSDMDFIESVIDSKPAEYQGWGGSGRRKIQSKI